jgi:hypothetical protein
MKKIVILFVLVTYLTGCAVFGGGQKSGCPSNGANIGAEKIAAGDVKAMKQAKKAPKFKG